MAGLFTAGVPVGSIVGALNAGWIRSRVAVRRQQMYLTGVVCTASMLTMSLAPVTPLMPLGAFGMGWACMQVFPTLVAIPYELPGIKPREVAVVASLMMSIFTVGGVLGPPLAGVVEQATGSLQWGLMAATLTHLGIFVVFFASEAGLPLLPRVRQREAATVAA